MKMGGGAPTFTVSETGTCVSSVIQSTTGLLLPEEGGGPLGLPCKAKGETRYLLWVFMHIYPAAQCQNKDN